MDMLFSKSVLLWRVSFLALLEKLALPGRSFLGDRDFDGAVASGDECCVDVLKPHTCAQNPHDRVSVLDGGINGAPWQPYRA
jgi:hypothetical protein